MTAEYIKAQALKNGAAVCGIADAQRLRDEDAKHNPFSILPHAKCVIGFGIPVPRGLYRAMEEGRQFYNYTNLGVKYIDETFAEIFLLKMGRLIEDEGYDACLQRSIPGFRVQGDTSTNPEVSRTYELKHASAVSEDRAVPDVILDTGRAAAACGLGRVGLHGKVIAPRYGTFLRYVFIITDMPLEVDAPFGESLCDACGACRRACPGGAIGEDGVDSWQCSVYYRGAHESNPFMTEDTLAGHPEREAIVKGKKHFDSEEARGIYPSLSFLPNTHFGYVPCLCAKACETACYHHLKETGRL
ncbi:MAG: hypothetical protein E7363_00075 [Clostridiales bacterium]|nr:hypothetical protein [Clostridiales bacterium]